MHLDFHKMLSQIESGFLSESDALKRCSIALKLCTWQHEAERIITFVKRLAQTSLEVDGQAGEKVEVKAQRQTCMTWLVEHVSFPATLPIYTYPDTQTRFSQETFSFFPDTISENERIILCPCCKGYGSNYGKPVAVRMQSPSWQSDLVSHIMRDHERGTWYRLSIHELSPILYRKDYAKRDFVIVENLDFAPNYVPLAEVRMRESLNNRSVYKFIPASQAIDKTKVVTDITDSF